MQSRTDPMCSLLIEWQTRPRMSGCGFASDGVIDGALWLTAPRKILFIAKDPNDFNGDLCDLFRNKPWKRPGTWAYGLQHTQGDGTPRIAEAEQNMADAFRASAWINIKKEPGGSTADRSQILAAAQRDGDLLLRQIALIAPEVVVCCGTFQILQEAVLVPKTFPRTKSGEERCNEIDGAVWIDYVHPGTRWRKEVMYYGLTGMYSSYLRPPHA